MAVSMTVIARMTLYAFFLGIALGAFYDLVRISRVLAGVSYGGKSAERFYEKKYPLIGKLKRKKGALRKGFTEIFVAVGDILFFTFAGIVFAVFIYYTNDGIFRFHALFASALGFLLYHGTLGVIIISFAEIISIFLKIFIKIFLYAIAFPFKIMYNITIKLVKRVFGVPYAWFSRKARLFATERRLKILRRKASFGFLEKFLKGQDN